MQKFGLSMAGVWPKASAFMALSSPRSTSSKVAKPDEVGKQSVCALPALPDDAQGYSVGQGSSRIVHAKPLGV